MAAAPIRRERKNWESEKGVKKTKFVHVPKSSLVNYIASASIKQRGVRGMSVKSTLVRVTDSTLQWFPNHLGY